MENLGGKLRNAIFAAQCKNGTFALIGISDNLLRRFIHLEDCAIRKENDRIYAELVEKKRKEIAEMQIRAGI